MPLTKLDAAAALIVIDLQKGIVDLPTVRPAAEIIDRSAQLARAFRARSTGRSRPCDGQGSGSDRRRDSRVFVSPGLD